MPTTDERREVTARLREQKAWNIFTNFEDCIGDLCDAVFEDEGDLNDMFRLQRAIADLIEPEPERTCRNVGYYSDSTRFECSECEFNGWVKWAKDGKDRVPGYCPNCGARVEEEA